MNERSIFLELIDLPQGERAAYLDGTCAGNPEVVYVSFQNLQSSDYAIYSGVAKSIDYGKSWHLAWKDVNWHGVMRPSENFSKDWLNDRFGASWGENPLS